jgi:hypothetical protein
MQALKGAGSESVQERFWTAGDWLYWLVCTQDGWWLYQHPRVTRPGVDDGWELVFVILAAHAARRRMA